MGDTYDHQHYYNNTCSSSASASALASGSAAQPHRTSDEMSLFLQQILVRSSNSLAHNAGGKERAPPQLLFSSSPTSVAAALPDHLSRPSHSSIAAVDSSPEFVPAGNPNVSSSLFGMSENEADEYDRESEEGLEALVEEDQEVGAKPGGARSSSKRSRAAEVHNLSEKRRRSRINEKMKALQNLIPNSNKTDKASMLDEAIEYLKQLQLQVQMLSMRNGMNLHSMCPPGALQPVQLSQTRTDLGGEIRPLHLDMAGTLHMNQDSSPQNLFQLSNQCDAANQSYVPDMSNVVNSATSFGLESSVQAHLGTFQLPNSSEEIGREDPLQHQQINVNHFEMNPLAEFDLGASARVSLPFNAQLSDMKGSSSLGTCMKGRDLQEGRLLKAIEQHFHIDSMRTGRRVQNDQDSMEAQTMHVKLGYSNILDLV